MASEEVKRRRNNYYSRRGCYRYKQWDIKFINEFMKAFPNATLANAIEFRKVWSPEFAWRLCQRVKFIEKPRRANPVMRKERQRKEEDDSD